MTPPNKLGDNSRWFVLVAQERENIDRLSRSIGRIACANGSAVPVLGTGWRIGPDLIVTNRHVAASLMLDRHATPETWKLDPNKQAFIDFAYTDETAGPLSFKLGDLQFCGGVGDLLQKFAQTSGEPSECLLEWYDRPTSTVSSSGPAHWGTCDKLGHRAGDSLVAFPAAEAMGKNCFVYRQA